MGRDAITAADIVGAGGPIGEGPAELPSRSVEQREVNHEPTAAIRQSPAVETAERPQGTGGLRAKLTRALDWTRRTGRKPGSHHSQ